MSNGFSFALLGQTHWIATLKLAVARSFFAGIVWTIVMSLVEPMPLLEVLYTPFVFILFAIPIALFLQICAAIAGGFIPALGWFMSAVGSLMVCAGDPIVYLINRQFPALLNIADFNIINFEPILFITHPE